MSEKPVQWFYPLKGEVHSKPILAFDIEGSGGEGKFVCGSIAGEYISNFFTDREDMFEALLEYAEQGFWIFAHNLEYDLPILAGEDFWRGDMLFTVSRILWVDYKTRGGKARFMDSLNLFPRMSVQELGRELGLHKLELPKDIFAMLQMGIPWGSLSAVAQMQVEEYCRRDAEIVYRAVNWLQEVALELGGQLKPTIAGVAMDIYRRRFQRWPWKSVGEATNELIRPGFYGGRTENLAFGRVPKCNMYDVTSLYPSVQAKVRYPHPSYLRMADNPRPTGHWLHWEGMVSCQVNVPDCQFPPLPYRHRELLFFPTGLLRGIWTIGEIREAVERGCQVRAVDWVIGSSVMFNPFEDFVEHLFRHRILLQSQGDTRQAIVKIILNALYGRFGLNPEGGLSRVLVPDIHTEHDPLRGQVECTVGNWIIVLGQVKTTKYPSYVNVFIASQVTAAGRAVLLSELERQGDDAVYCDTDSIITRGEVEVGKGLGTWRQQMQEGTAELFGAKEYMLRNKVLGDVYHVKGVPNYIAKEYIETGNARFTRALRVREALRSGRNPSEWVQTYRNRGENIPKRCLIDYLYQFEAGWTLTRPWADEELESVSQRQYFYRRYSPEGVTLVYSETDLANLHEAFGRPL